MRNAGNLTNNNL